MKKALVLVLVSAVFLTLFGCAGVDLEKMAAEQKAAQVAGVKGRMMVDGKIVEPPYKFVVGNPDLKAPALTVVYLNRAKIFPAGKVTIPRKQAESFVADAEKTISEGKLFILSTDSDFTEKRDMAVLSRIKEVLASAKTDSQKTDELVNIVQCSYPMAKAIVMGNK